MERSFLKALGLNDDQINAVFSEYGREKTAHDTELNNLKEQLKTANAKAETVKLYEKGGEKYIDPTEYANLKQYKVDTEKAAVEKKQKESAAELFKSYSETNKRFLTDIEGMPKVEKLNALVCNYVNWEYTLPNGAVVKFLNDGETYLGNQLECKFGGERCFGILADMSFLLVCTYETDGKKPELVLYKKR